MGFIAHNAAFDLKVTQAVLGDRLDLYALVEDDKVWDTLILNRLLSLATAGHTARGESGLDDCVRAHLGLELPKDLRDAEGRDVRTGFGRFLGRPLGEIPEAYLRYAAGDPLATWHLFWELHRRIKGVLQSAPEVWGYVDDAWLRDAIRRFGPLTHHIQLRASIVTDVLRTNGIAVDAGRGAEKLARVREAMDGGEGADAAARLPGRPAGQRQGHAVDPGAVPARAPGRRAAADRVGREVLDGRGGPGRPGRRGRLLRRLRRVPRGREARLDLPDQDGPAPALPEVRLPGGDGADLVQRLQPPEPAQGEGRGGRRRHDPRLLRAGRGQGLHRRRLLADRAGRPRLRPGPPVRPGHLAPRPGQRQRRPPAHRRRRAGQGPRRGHQARAGQRQAGLLRPARRHGRRDAPPGRQGLLRQGPDDRGGARAGSRPTISSAPSWTPTWPTRSTARRSWPRRWTSRRPGTTTPSAPTTTPAIPRTSSRRGGWRGCS